MRFIILLLTISFVISSPFSMQRVPRQLPFDDQASVSMDDWLLPTEPFEDFDFDQDTVSTQLFDTLPSPIYPFTALDPNSPFLDSETLEDYRISIYPSFLSEELREKNRFFPAPVRKCASYYRPFCSWFDATEESPGSFSLRDAIDGMCFYYLFFIFQF